MLRNGVLQTLVQGILRSRNRPCQGKCEKPELASPEHNTISEWIISPESSRYKVWRAFSTFSAICHAWCVPAMSHFNVPSTGFVSLLFHLTWAILIVDLLVCAMTASTDRDDTIGLLPLNVPLANSHATYFASFHYFNRVLVLFRVWWWFERLNNRVMSMYVLWAVKAIVTLILGTHYLACVWWVIGRIDSDWRNGIPSWSQRAAKSAQWKSVLSTDAQSPDVAWAPLWFRQYIVSLYWVVNMALIPEASHLSVQSFQERWMGKVVYIVAQMYIAWIGSSLTSVLANSRAIRTTMQKRADVIMDFLKTSKLPQHLRKRVKEYLNFSWLRNRGVDATTLLDDLPSTLRAELALKAYGHLLTKVPLFSGADDAFFRALSLALRPILFLEGEDIVRQGDLGAEMFALLRGSVHIIAVAADGSEKIVSTLHQGAYFGEISLYLSRPRTVTVRAATRVDILVLTKQSLDAVLKLYPDVHSRIIAMAQERLRQDAQRAGALTDPAAKEPQTPQVELEPASVVRPSQGLSNRRQSLLVSVAPRNVPFPPGEPFVSRSRRISRDRTVDMDGQSGVGSSNQDPSRSPVLKTPSGSPLPARRPNADNRMAGAHHSVSRRHTRSFKSLPRDSSKSQKPSRSIHHPDNHQMFVDALMNALQVDTFGHHQSRGSVESTSCWFSAHNSLTALQFGGSAAPELGNHSRFTSSSCERGDYGQGDDGKGSFTARNSRGSMQQPHSTGQMSLGVPRDTGSFASRAASQWSGSRLSAPTGSKSGAYSRQWRGSDDAHLVSSGRVGQDESGPLQLDKHHGSSTLLTASDWTGSARSMQTIATVSSASRSQFRSSRKPSQVANHRLYSLNLLLQRTSTASRNRASVVTEPQQPLPLAAASSGQALLSSRRTSLVNALSVVAERKQEDKRANFDPKPTASPNVSYFEDGNGSSVGSSINVSLDFLFLDIAQHRGSESQVDESGVAPPRVQTFHNTDSEEFQYA